MNAILTLTENLRQNPNCIAQDVSYAVHLPWPTLAECVKVIIERGPAMLAATEAHEQKQADDRAAQFAAEKKKRDEDELLAAHDRQIAAQRTPEAIDARLRQLETAAGGKRKL